MEQKVNENPYLLSIHSLVKVWAPALRADIQANIDGRLGRFAVKKVIKPKQPDIVIEKLTERDPALDELASIMGKHNNSWFTEFNGSDAVVFKYRERPDVIVTLSNPIRILYYERPGVADRVYGSLFLAVQIALCRKGAILFHGAVLKKGRKTVILTGASGSRKSIVALCMLKNGWDFLSDDKCILKDEKAFCFQKPILDEFHLKVLPWLPYLIEDSVKILEKARKKKRIKSYSEQHLPSYLLPAVKRFYRSSLMLDIQDIFPEAKLLKSAKPTHTIMLGTGPELKIKEVAHKRALKDLSLIHTLFLGECEHLLECHSLYNGEVSYDFDKLIKSNFTGLKLLRLTMTELCDFEEVYRLIEKTLKGT